MSEPVQGNGRIEDLTGKVKAAREKLEQRTLTVKELAQVLGIGETKARELMRSKSFPSFRISNKYLVSIVRFEQWLNEAEGKQF